MKILFIAHRLPYPPNKGDKIRAYNILEHFTRHNEVHLVTHVDDEADLEYIDAIRNKAASLSYARIDKTSRAWKAVVSFFSGRSITQEYFYSVALQRQVDALLKEHNFDVLFCSSSPTAEYFYRSGVAREQTKNCRKIMDFIDIDSAKWDQYSDQTGILMRGVYKRESQKLLAYERKIGRDFDWLMVVSSNEAELFSSGDDNDKMRAIGNGVDLEFFAPGAHPDAAERPTLVFVGMMDYWPNIDGMQWFLDRIWPDVIREEPECRVVVVGGRPPANVQAWGKLENVEVTGFVEDVRDYMHRATLSIVPLRIARGIQNKVLEAMSVGKAIVATPQAVEGIEVTANEHVAVASSAATFAKAIVSLIRDQNKAAMMGAAARKQVEQVYSWRSRLQALDELLESTPQDRHGRQQQ